MPHEPNADAATAHPAAHAASASGAPSLPPAAPAGTPSAVVAAARRVAIGSLLALIALGLAWELWLAPTGSGTLAIKVVPLALAIGGLLRDRLHTFRWLSLLVWLYFMEGTVRATTEAGVSQALAVAEIVLSLLLFAAVATVARLRSRRATPTTAGAAAPVPESR